MHGRVERAGRVHRQRRPRGRLRRSASRPACARPTPPPCARPPAVGLELELNGTTGPDTGFLVQFVSALRPGRASHAACHGSALPLRGGARAPRPCPTRPTCAPAPPLAGQLHHSPGLQRVSQAAPRCVPLRQHTNPDGASPTQGAAHRGCSAALLRCGRAGQHGTQSSSGRAKVAGPGVAARREACLMSLARASLWTSRRPVCDHSRSRPCRP